MWRPAPLKKASRKIACDGVRDKDARRDARSKRRWDVRGLPVKLALAHLQACTAAAACRPHVPPAQACLALCACCHLSHCQCVPTTHYMIDWQGHEKASCEQAAPAAAAATINLGGTKGSACR